MLVADTEVLADFGAVVAGLRQCPDFAEVVAKLPVTVSGAGRVSDIDGPHLHPVALELR